MGYYSAFAELRGLGSRRITSDMQVLYKHGNGFRDNNAFDQVNGTVKTQFRLSNKKVLYLKANANFENSNATYTGLTEYSFYANPKIQSQRRRQFQGFAGLSRPDVHQQDHGEFSGQYYGLPECL